MSGIITRIEVSKSIAPLVDICGEVLSPPYIIPQFYYVCVTAYIKNTGALTEEYKLELFSPQGSLVDSEPDYYWINASPGETVALTVSGALNNEGTYNFSVRVKRCECTSWTGCYTSCDAEPVDDTENIQVSTPTEPPPSECAQEGEQWTVLRDCCPGLVPVKEGFWGFYYCRVPDQPPPPPPADKYYNCIGGKCVQVSGTSGYKNDPTCQGKCTTTPPPPPPSTKKYYTCVNGRCVQVGYQTQYVNDATCGGKCIAAPPPSDGEDNTADNTALYAGIVAVGLGAGYYLYKKSKQKR